MVAMERPFRWRLQLPIGRYVAAAETADGATVEQPFEMTSLADDQPKVRLDARVSSRAGSRARR